VKARPITSGIVFLAVVVSVACGRVGDWQHERRIARQYQEDLDRYCQTDPHDPSSVFQKEPWNSGDPAVRGAMARDILCSRRFLGKTRSDVIASLGPPDFEDHSVVMYRIVRDPALAWPDQVTARLDEQALRFKFSVFDFKQVSTVQPAPWRDGDS
jgi:hypothetical protein